MVARARRGLRPAAAKRHLEGWTALCEDVEIELASLDVHAIDVERNARVANGEG